MQQGAWFPGRRSGTLIRWFAIAAQSASLMGCVTTYGIRPEAAWSAVPPEAGQYEETVYYHIPNLTRASLAALAGNPESLRESFLNNHPFTHVEAVIEPPAHGTFVDVLVMTRDGSGIGLVWSYISYAFLFTLPAYLGSSGYSLKYRVFIDGELQRTFEYQVDRKVFAWLPLLPFIWINALTDSESDAFNAATRRFLQDAAKAGLFARREEPVAVRMLR